MPRPQVLVSAAGWLGAFCDAFSRVFVEKVGGEESLGLIHALGDGSERSRGKLRRMAEVAVSPITDHQRQCLEWFIASMEGGTRIGKQLMIWMLRMSQNLSCSVAVSFRAELDGGKLDDTNCLARKTIHLRHLCVLLGAHMRFSSAAGRYDEFGGWKTPSEAPDFRTYWLTPCGPDHSAKVLLLDLEAIGGVDLTEEAILGPGFWAEE